MTVSESLSKCVQVPQSASLILPLGRRTRLAPNRRRPHYVALRRTRAAPERVAGDQRKRVFGRWFQQAYILRFYDANHCYGVGTFMQSARSLIKPFEVNRVALFN